MNQSMTVTLPVEVEGMERSRNLVMIEEIGSLTLDGVTMRLSRSWPIGLSIHLDIKGLRASVDIVPVVEALAQTLLRAAKDQRTPADAMPKGAK